MNGKVSSSDRALVRRTKKSWQQSGGSLHTPLSLSVCVSSIEHIHPSIIHLLRRMEGGPKKETKIALSVTLLPRTTTHTSSFPLSSRQHSPFFFCINIGTYISSRGRLLFFIEGLFTSSSSSIQSEVVGGGRACGVGHILSCCSLETCVFLY